MKFGLDEKTLNTIKEDTGAFFVKVNICVS